MTEPTQFFRTLNGEPPNGGVPPGTAFYGSFASPPAAPAIPPPPYPMHHLTPQLDPRMFLPPQEAFLPPPPPPPPVQSPPYTQDFPYHVQLFTPPPPPPPPAPTPPQWSPPGASLLGQPAPNFGGVEYLYPRDNTVLHVIMDKYMTLDTTTRLPKWEPRLFPTGLTVGELIAQLGAPEGPKFGLMEVHEQGDGRWAAGQVILQGSEDAKKTLREVGWVETRGFSAKPVWLKIHEGE
ncbi:MAG: hypothetical protein L6R39_006389 [Caloplaca ligustica]|nr:MAG: hypothetical protein L6R39_006389 [Caloplaca ligustica]